jgi:hypothetical protein
MRVSSPEAAQWLHRLDSYNQYGVRPRARDRDHSLELGFCTVGLQS